MLAVPSLRCRIGWHAPRGGGVWNHGYCFTTCRRCGRDMVRSAFGEWHVPKGFRVVAHGDAAAIAGFDAAMTARDRANAPDRAAAERMARVARVAAAAPRPAAPRVTGPAAAPLPAPTNAAPPSDTRSPRGSPFDFEDFDSIDSTMGVFADHSRLPDPATRRSAAP